MPQKERIPLDWYQDETVDIKAEVRKYLVYWPWFVLGLLIALGSAYFYLRYTGRIYETQAKIKILDESDGLELPTSAFIFKRSNINLENEREILSSYIILEQVVRDLQLNTSFYEEGNIQTSQRADLPFAFEQLVTPDSITTDQAYKIEVAASGFEIENLKTENVRHVEGHSTYNQDLDLPFQIRIADSLQETKSLGRTYLVFFTSVKKAVLGLKQQLVIEAIGEQSDLLKLSLKGASKDRSEAILNKLMDVFNQDGIKDRQLVSKRTLEFIDDRFVYLAQELDSIEVDRQEFKQRNNLVEFEVDAQVDVESRSTSDAALFQVENQLALAQLLTEALKPQDTVQLLPANIGLDNASINTAVTDYNTAVLNYDKIAASGGANNPAVRVLADQITRLRGNITRSLQTYVNQLQLSKTQLEQRNQRFVGQVAALPKKEKLLRAIERQQKIKESLYLLLLQKREEAAINLAITEPSIKVVEYALSGLEPISPKPKIIYIAALLLGLLLPFGILYLRFLLDTKVHVRDDLTTVNPQTPIVAEIPDMQKDDHKLFVNPNDRSVLAEAFRILIANLNYSLPKDRQNGHVVYCTSSIKGEGKTFVSLNLSLGLSSLNKKVLLIGADLRNPQIHTLIQTDKDQKGLSNYLHDPAVDWTELCFQAFDKHPNHHILLSGSIPPNPPSLLTNGRFEALLEAAREQYDYVIVDTAPTVLVTDTILISKWADAILYLVRANVTETDLLQFSKELVEQKKLNNLLYVLNAVGAGKSRGYGYGYGYGYNYGYGYGYGTGPHKKPWYKRLF